mgnify:CR=1 FL=1
MLQKTETFTISEFLNRKEKKKEESLEEKMNFFLKTYLEEVKVAKPKQKKKYQSLLLKTASVSLSLLVTATPALAQTSSPISIPNEVDSLIQTIQLICLGLIAGVATICLMLAGAMRIVGLGEKAKGWSTEILKGTLQVVSAPVVIWLIITVMKGLLSPLPGFQNF